MQEWQNKTNIRIKQLDEAKQWRCGEETSLVN